MCLDSRNSALSTSAHRVRGWTRFVLILFAASACSAWRPHSVETSTPQTGRLHGAFRVTVRDGSSVEMKDVLISSDSITGLRTGLGKTEPVEWVAVPRSQVIAFERRSFSAIRTVGAAAGAYVVLAVVAVVAMVQGTGPNY